MELDAGGNPINPPPADLPGTEEGAVAAAASFAVAAQAAAAAAAAPPVGAAPSPSNLQFDQLSLDEQH